MSDKLLWSVDLLLDAVESMPSSWAPHGYVIDSGETDDHPTHDNVYCHRHTRLVASRESTRTKCDMYVLDVSWGETDSSEWCAYPRCRRELDTGSLTEYGVDNALALTETNPLADDREPCGGPRA